MTNAITATANATTIKKNFSKILYRVINQISQKFSLDSDSKKKITDFVAQRVNGEIKTVFPKYGLPDGNFEYATFPFGNNVILLAYGANPDKDEYPNILYACVREIPKKEDEIKKIEILKTLSNVDRDKILVGTVSRVTSQLKTFMTLSLDDLAQTKIYNFLLTQGVNGRVGVIFTPELPTSDEYSKTQIRVGDYDLDLVYGTNPVKNKYPNVLWVNVSKSQEVLEREFMQKRECMFREFWNKNQLPQELLEEVIQNVDVKERVTLAVYARASDWNRYRKVERNSIIVIGQNIDKKTGNFVPNQPIGYVKGNHVVITSPENLLRFACYEFK